MTSQERIISLLRTPEAYPHDADDIRVHETHISRVFLAGPYAYKMKKALDLGFLDYSTLELRETYCEEEVRLNRRLAPSVYLGVAAVRGGKEDLYVDVEGTGQDPLVEPLVRMKRLSPEVMLDSLLERGEARSEHIDRLMELLLPFYESAPRFLDPRGHGGPDALRRTLRGNFEATEPDAEILSAERLRAIRAGQLSFLTLRNELFERRVREGRIRDGHGDLRAEHVAYLPGCAVMDCIEFNESFRLIDVAADLAFLRMDLEFLGAPDLGEHLIERYRTETGDRGVDAVLDFYLSYRAFVRGKVDSIKLRQGGLEERERLRLTKRAKRYFELSHFHTLAFHEPFLVLVGGLSGTGKSTLSRSLAETLGAPLLRSDEIRKELSGMAPEDRQEESFERGIYSEEHTRRTYEELARRASALLGEGAAAIVDATLSRRWQRRLLRRAGQSAGGGIVHLECRVSSEVARERMKGRRKAGGDPSDASPEIQEEQRRRYEPPEPGESTALDTSASTDRVTRSALEALRKALGSRPQTR